MERWRAWGLVAAIGAVPGAVHADGTAVPSAQSAPSAAPVERAAAPDADAAFLEYLGSWDGDDEDWVMMQHAGRKKGAPTPPVANGQVTTPAAGDSPKPPAGGGAGAPASPQE